MEAGAWEYVMHRGFHKMLEQKRDLVMIKSTASKSWIHIGIT